MNRIHGLLCALLATLVMTVSGCGGGGGGAGSEAVGLKASGPNAGVTAEPGNAATQTVRDLAADTDGVLTKNDPPTPKLGESDPSQRPLVLSAFSREHTYRLYAGNGTRKLLRLDFAAGRYEMLDDSDAPNGGHSTSGSFSEDSAEPGTYIFSTARSTGVYNLARFRVTQGAVVGGFFFETHPAAAPSYTLQPFVAARDFVSDPAELDGEYNRLGVRNIALFKGHGIGEVTPLRISGSGTVLEICPDADIRRLELCQSIARYALNNTTSDGVWTATKIGSADQIQFRMARIGGRNVWLEAGMALEGAKDDSAFKLALPNSANLKSARYFGVSNDGYWCMNDVGRNVWARRCTYAGGQLDATTTWLSPSDAGRPSGLRWMYINNQQARVATDSTLVIAVVPDGTVEIGLFKELLTAEPPSPPSSFNGTYKAFALNGLIQDLSLNFDTGNYRVTDSAGHTTSGTFTEDASDPGTYVFASSRISVIHNTARFRRTTDGIVGAFPFATHGSNPTTFKIMPFIAARRFAMTRNELAGTYDTLVIPGNTLPLRINPEGTTVSFCHTLTCDTAADTTSPINEGPEPGQWTISFVAQSLRFYVARFGSRKVLLASGEFNVPTSPPNLLPMQLVGFHEPPIGYDSANWPTYRLHVTSGSGTFGKATLDNTRYEFGALQQDGQPYMLSMNIQPALINFPLVRAATGTAGSFASIAHDGELFALLSIVDWHFGLIDH